jgi:group I intron endonuclease
MYHFVYKTTNKKNNKIYVGKHSTDNLNDGYLGSGPTLLRAVNKHGRENFTTEILHFCETEEEAIEIERSIVDEVFVQRDDTYNINVANQGFTWTGKKRPEQAEVMRQAEPWKFKKPQIGERNPAFGKPAHNRKPLKATRGSEIVIADSIKEMAVKLGINRAAIRANVEGRSKNRNGWEITYI